MSSVYQFTNSIRTLAASKLELSSAAHLLEDGGKASYPKLPLLSDDFVDNNQDMLEHCTKLHYKQVMDLRQNIASTTPRLYAFIKLCLSPEVLLKVQAQSVDYKAAEEDKDPKKLLAIIQNLFNGDTLESPRAMQRSSALHIFTTEKQRPGESLVAYGERRATMYNQAQLHKLLGEGVDDEVQAAIFLEGLAPEYQPFKENLLIQVALSPDIFPDTVQQAIIQLGRLGANDSANVDIGISHSAMFGKTSIENLGQQRKPNNPNFACKHCGKNGHFPSSCPKATPKERAEDEAEHQKRRMKGKAERDAREAARKVKHEAVKRSSDGEGNDSSKRDDRGKSAGPKSAPPRSRDREEAYKAFLEMMNEVDGPYEEESAFSSIVIASDFGVEEEDQVNHEAYTYAAVHGEPGKTYFDSGATTNIRGSVLGKMGELARPVRLSGVCGKITVTNTSGTAARGIDALLVPGSVHLLSASRLKKTHFLIADLDANYFVLPARDQKRNDDLVFVKDMKGLYPLVKQLAPGLDGRFRTVWDDHGEEGLDERDVQGALKAAGKFRREMHEEHALVTRLKRAVLSQNSVENNIGKLGVRELLKAKIVRLAARVTGAHDDALKRLLRRKGIIGLKASAQDVDVATNTFGRDLYASETHKKSTPQHRQRERQYPREPDEAAAREQRAYTDGAKISGGQFMVTTFKPLGLKIGALLKDQSAASIIRAILKHIRAVRGAGLPVGQLGADNWPALKESGNSMMLADCGIKLSTGAVNAHQVDVESAINPSRVAIQRHLIRMTQAFGFAPPFSFLEYVSQHVHAMHAFIPKGNERLTAGQRFYGRDLEAEEAIFLPGQYAISKVPTTTRPAAGKNDLKAEPVIYLCANISPTITATVYSLRDLKTAERKISELEHNPMPVEVLRMLKTMADREVMKIIVAETLPTSESEPDMSMVRELLEPLNPIPLRPKKDRGAQEPPRLTLIPAGKDRGAQEKSLPEPEDTTGKDRGAREQLREEPTSRPQKLGIGRAIAIAVIEDETPKEIFAYNMSVDEALQLDPAAVIESIKQEIENVFNRTGTFIPVDWRSLTPEELKRRLPSKMFVKEKFDAAGAKGPYKARLVGGGHRQNKSAYTNLSAPTVSLCALKIVLSIAAHDNMLMKVTDIPYAYLNAELDENEEEGDIYMTLDKETSKIVISMMPQLEKYLDEKGRLTGLITKSLYGLIQSAHNWHKHISGTLKDKGFVENPYDVCVMNKSTNGVITIVAIFVDDVIIFSKEVTLIDDCIQILEDKYGPGLKTQHGPLCSYIGMLVDSTVIGQITLTMRGYVNKMISDFSVTGNKSHPALPDILVRDEQSPLLSAPRKARYTSATMTAMYLAKRTRHETCFAVSCLSRQTANPTVQDEQKLEHLLQYFNGTQELGVTLKPGNSLEVSAHVDASYGNHEDFKSHTGSLIFIGNPGGAPVHVKSSKQAINSKSSTGAELNGASSSGSQVIWVRNFVIEQGHEIPPARMYQDNLSTIALIKSGKAKAENSRHTNIRQFWLADRIAAGELVVEYMPTNKILADALTKAQTGSLFLSMRSQILGHSLVKREESA